MTTTLRVRLLTFRAQLLGLAIGVGALGILVIHAIWLDGVAGQVSYLAFTVGGAAVAVVAGRRLTGPAARPWRWAAAGLAFSALADVYWEVNALMGAPAPDVSPADGAWLLSYVFLIAAMFALLRDIGDGVRDDLEGLVDTLTALVVSSLVLWELLVAPVLDDHSVGLGIRLIWGSYPLFDAILLALVIRTFMSRRAGSVVGGLLVAGTTCWLLSDLASNLWVTTRTTTVMFDTGWMVGAALLGLATWVAAHGAPRASAGAHPRAVPGRISGLRVALTVAPLLVPAGLEVWSDRQGQDTSVRLLVGTVALAVLAGARSMLFLRTRDEAERRLRSSERYFKALAANSADAVLVLDATGVIKSDSPHLAALLGHTDQSLYGIQALSAVCTEDAPDASALHARVLSSPGMVFEGELRLKAADGSEPWLAVRIVNLLDDVDVRGIVVNFHEISDRKEAEAELVHLAFHDSLTGLANRALFHDRVDHALEVGGIGAAAVVFLDLDGFKHVNDGLGHDAGDELLGRVAGRLQRAARPGDTVARLGGDEFALLLEHCTDPRTTAEEVADRILRMLTAPLELADGTVTLSASIGIAVAEPGATASSLLRDSDAAMYEAKAAGRGRRVMYTPVMRTATLERLRLGQDLASALEKDQLRVAYQPVVHLTSGDLIGFEALLRWDHPVLGPIVPDRFIPIAEQSGLIIPIGQWVLETACRTAAGWQARHPQHRDLTMAVNISARQLASSDLVNHVEDALTGSGLRAASLVLEMTETVLVEDPVTASGRLRQLRRLGVRLAIDDFGTGYSSLSYLRQFPVDILKIDRSFIASMEHSDEVPALVHGLLELGHTLGLEIVAEGIESIVQLDHLRSERCPLGQGFLFSPAVTAAEAEELLVAGGFPPHVRPVAFAEAAP